MEYSWSIITKHDRIDDAWIVIDGYVHDVTKFIHQHPGGYQIVEEQLGKDASSLFTDKSIHEHSTSAYAILKNFRIGIVENSKVLEHEELREKEKLHQMVDSNAAILPQLPYLGANYQPWVHSNPVFGSKGMIIFPFNFLEIFTRWPWWYVLAWAPISSYCFFLSLQNSIVLTFFYFILGILLWGLLEYTLHRFVFHYITESGGGNVAHYFMHGIHHLTPTDSMRLTFPPYFTIFLGVSVYKLFWAILPEQVALPLYSGLTISYMMYDVLHFLFHRCDLPYTWFRHLKTNHLKHHYKDQSKNFGVTSPLFDYIFGTY